MFKKLLIASAVLALSSGAFAHSYKGEYKDMGPAPCPTYTYTTGPYIGLSIGPRVNITGHPVAFKGFDGVLSLGWGMLFPPMWYLAGELFAGGSANLKNYKDADGHGVRSTWSWGGSIIPGFMLTDHVLAFLRVGAQRTRFSDVSVHKTGWHVGLGGQTNVYQNWDVRAEYIYSQYGSTDNIGKPTTDQFLLGVVYKFV